MRNKSLIAGLAFALVSVALVLGGLTLSYAEAIKQATPTPVLALVFPTVTPQVLPSPTLVQPSPTALPSATAEPSLPPTLTPTACPIPAGWTVYTLQPGDTLESLASVYQVDLEVLVNSNCLSTDSTDGMTSIYVPPLATPTPAVTNTTAPCSQPPGWIVYTIQAGDYLGRIASTYNITLAQLREVNCLGSLSVIRPGQKLYVPSPASGTNTATPSS